MISIGLSWGINTTNKIMLSLDRGMGLKLM
jgi:hypothetical protein